MKKWRKGGEAVMHNQTNTNAITSLIFGILSIVIPILGLILGIIGIVFSRKAVKEINYTNENGRGIATAGLICSIIGIIIQLFSLLGILAFLSVATFS